ncbi:hypothetical protein ILUMI_11744 [Ignelater luminosus]|uniref:Transmembrane protein 256 homolog n=1 Tax=Ignelater luminosus TaxID=2038154 RepID=A0A8K0CZY5_IGNLU|nr:hypothetical protein ILUMI_11744 [Ignelater luminosus]
MTDNQFKISSSSILNMNPKDLLNYVVFDNPVSKAVLKPFIKNAPVSMPPAPVTIITERVPLWQLAAQQGPFIRLAGICGASAVILGAYGSHKTYPKDRAKELKSIYETANRFHFLHTLALFGVPLCRNPRVTGSLMIVGTVFFSGACYYHAFTGEDKFGRLAPVGGTILILAWLSMVF